MNGCEFKLLFKQHSAYLTNEKPLSLAKAGLADTLAMQKGFRYPAYWMVKVINHDEHQRKIFCQVLSYHEGETEFDYKQKQLSDKLNTIEIVKFRNIDSNGLFKSVLNKGWGSIYPSRTVATSREKYSYEETSVKTESSVRSAIPIVQPYNKTFNETFSVSLKNVRFIPGGVSFEKKLPWHHKPISFTITNDDIKEEYDAVKNYFGNVLKTKKIQVTVTIELSDYKIVSTNAKSPEIEKINKELIDSVKIEFVKATTRKNINIEKNLFTIDEYFETFTDDKFEANPFYKNEEDFFGALLDMSNTKHYKHLRFLSSKHAHRVVKLHFIHQPFSFIFLLQGDINYHIVWETLNTTEATYVWHIARDFDVFKLKLKEVENIMSVMKAQGKRKYINTTGEEVSRVFHDYSEGINGFIKWQSDLEACLT